MHRMMNDLIDGSHDLIGRFGSSIIGECHADRFGKDIEQFVGRRIVDDVMRIARRVEHIGQGTFGNFFFKAAHNYS